MRRVERLIREARESIQFRGHVAGRFKRFEHNGRECATYQCPCCEATVQKIA